MKKYKMPTKSNLKSRISTMNNAFAYSIMPWCELSQDEYKSILSKLGIKENQCAYCLRNNATTMDHLYGLIKNSEPTGYYTEKNNLIPCCSSCNSSKSNYISQNKANKLDIANIIGVNDYNHYLKIKKELNDKIIECQLECEKIKDKLDNHLKNEKEQEKKKKQ